MTNVDWKMLLLAFMKHIWQLQQNIMMKQGNRKQINICWGFTGWSIFFTLCLFLFALSSLFPLVAVVFLILSSTSDCAEEREKRGDCLSAVAFYQKCLIAADFVHDISVSSPSFWIQFCLFRHSSVLAFLSVLWCSILLYFVLARHSSQLMFKKKEQSAWTETKSVAALCEMQNCSVLFLPLSFFKFSFSPLSRLHHHHHGYDQALGLANYRLGLCYFQLGDPKQAVGYEERYLALCQKSENRLGEGRHLSVCVSTVSFSAESLSSDAVVFSICLWVLWVSLSFISRSYLQRWGSFSLASLSLNIFLFSSHALLGFERCC